MTDFMYSRIFMAILVMKKLLFLFLVLVSIQLHAQITVSVSDDTTYQTIEGFGAFGGDKAWWENGPYYTNTFINQIVDNLGVNIVRTQIFWDGEPTNDNDDPHSTDFSKFNFGVSSDNGKQFSYLKELDAHGVKILGTVWTPPIWMKLLDDPDRIPQQCYNCNQCAIGAPGREMCGGRLNPEHYDEFAEYLVAYVKTLKEQTGVELYGISVQNEPFFANPFESNVVMPDEYADILKVVGERFDEEGLTTRFFGPEHMAEWSWGWQAKYVQEILDDPAVEPYLDIYAVHGYVDGVAADYGSAEGWTSLYENITLQHDKPLWMTETSDEQLHGYDLGFSMAKALYLALKFGRISAWVYWAMADAIIQNNNLTPLGYTFKNFYRFVRPGAVRIAAESSDTGVLTLAFRQPDSNELTIILINNSTQSKNVLLDVQVEHDTLNLFRTSSTENCKDLGVLPDPIVVLPAKSVSTITTIEGSGVVGIEKKSETSLSVFVYPNPATKRVEIEFATSKRDCQIEMIDQWGRVARKEKFSSMKNISIETEGLKTGMYHLKISDGHTVSYHKLFVE
jgi:glucuronoarabinoxylan endo-1,4-beta-xylanase